MDLQLKGKKALVIGGTDGSRRNGTEVSPLSSCFKASEKSLRGRAQRKNHLSLAGRSSDARSHFASFAPAS